MLFLETGNGRCDGGDFNTIECGWDGGDCKDFNANYTNCNVTNPFWLGDKLCDPGEYNTEGCGWDGGDCLISEYPTCTGIVPGYIGNGICNGGVYMTDACGNDGGDCIAFNLEYPDCSIKELSLQGGVIKSVILGDGVCDSGVYMTEECGYEGNDCNECANEIPDGSENLIGNGICNGGVYMTDACSNDGGDCKYGYKVNDWNGAEAIYAKPTGNEGTKSVAQNIYLMVFVILLCFVSAILVYITLKKNAGDGGMLVVESA